ncbi:hypothetical protein [Sphingomonas xinjiangensis]|uniref:Uncharacterized protein n=1 Tax=Sphingomonas xinjiangensis TaxID=643568 RepID=A0A840YSU1_9SPHN|nr:hypothetical protein [Sphingomonas xinjiangensis]MBB5712744.1 hypothetical protein [Sphingomonas xinjiangensis]
MSAAPTPDLEPAIAALLARYEQPSTLTGACHWMHARVTPVRDVLGQMLGPDEHSPQRFSPAEGSDLPEAARYGAAIAFPRDNPRLGEQAFSLPGEVQLSGSLVIGDLRCAGNSAVNVGAEQAFSATILVDDVKPAAGS